MRSIRTGLVVAALVCSGQWGSAQAPHAHLPADMMHVPDFAADPAHPPIVAVASGAWSSPVTWGGTVPAASHGVRIPAGLTVTVTEVPAAAHTVVVDGTLTCQSSVSTALTVTTLVVRAGTLRCEPQPHVSATFTIANSPIETGFDPEQWGHSILLLGGTARLKGTPKTAFVRLGAEPLAGQTVLTLAEPVTGWHVGDTVVIPDTREVGNGDVYLVGDRYRKTGNRTETRLIAGLAGSQLTLSESLAFDHVGARDSQGVLQRLPHVGNLSRNLVIRSANPAGVRGHLVAAHRADVAIEHVQIEAMGRTKAALLHSAIFEEGVGWTRIGTNQIGRYALHAHHLIGPEAPTQDGQFRFVGNAVTGGEKWCAAIHDSHFGLIQDNVLHDCIGAGLVFETGQETGNRVTHNFIVHTPGSPTVGRDAQGLKGDVGLEGFSIWVGGVGTDNAVHDNVGADGIVGINFPTPHSDYDPFLKCPTGPGMDTRDASVVCRPGDAPLRDFVGNEFYAHRAAGVGIWDVDRRLDKPAQIDDLTIWHVAGSSLGLANPGRIAFNRLSIFGSYAFAQNNYAAGFDTMGIFSSGVTQLTINDLTIANTTQAMSVDQPAYAPSIDQVFATFNRCDLRKNRAGVLYTRHNNDLPLSVFQTVTFSDCLIDGTPALNLRLPYREDMDTTKLVRFTVENYQRVAGDTFDIFTSEQAPDAPMPNTGTFIAPWGQAFAGQVGVSDVGLTNQQAWEKYGKAYAGRVAPTTTRAGVVGFVSTGAAPPPPPPPPPPPQNCTSSAQSTNGGATWTIVTSSIVCQ